MPETLLSESQIRDLQVMEEIKGILYRDKNSDVRISLSKDNQLRITKQKSRTVKLISLSE